MKVLVLKPDSRKWAVCLGSYTTQACVKSYSQHLKNDMLQNDGEQLICFNQNFYQRVSIVASDVGKMIFSFDYS